MSCNRSIVPPLTLMQEHYEKQGHHMADHKEDESYEKRDIR